MKLPRFLFGLFLFVVILVLLNVLLMFYMTQNRIGRFNVNEKLKFNYKVNEDSYLSIQDLPEDKSGRYYIHKNFIRAERTPSSRDVVLASHCTGDHLHHLVSLSEHWQGPLSIAVFVPGNSLETTLSTLYLLYGCFTKVRQQVSIHLVHPISALLDDNDIMFLIVKSEQALTKCSKALEVIQNWVRHVAKNYNRKVAYPNNLLRNIAKHAVSSKYTFIVDIDMKPNEDLYNDFKNFAIKNNLYDGGNSLYNNDSVFVLPAFEMDTRKVEDIPKDKTQLIKLIDRGDVRPFYYDICWKCQKPTDYEQWQSLGDSSHALDVGYEIKWKDRWEPFFISPNSAPDYDERFKQYGFNRISHACELHVAGYRYFVLNKGFLVHRGFKEMTSFHETKDEENDKNRILYRTFKTELKDKYPQSKKTC